MKLKFLLSFQLICHLRIFASQSIYFSILFKYFSLFKFFFHSSILSPFLFSYLSSPLILFYNNHAQINSHIKIHESQFTFKPPYLVKTIKPPEAKIILGFGLSKPKQSLLWALPTAMAIPKHPRNTWFAHEDHPFRNPEIIGTYHLLETPNRRGWPP